MGTALSSYSASLLLEVYMDYGEALRRSEEMPNLVTPQVQIQVVCLIMTNKHTCNELISKILKVLFEYIYSFWQPLGLLSFKLWCESQNVWL